MKTAGDLLFEKRQLLELSLADVSSRTKVKEKYLKALESSDFASLPSSTVVKGFLKSYARVLHLNPDTLIAMFRRDFEEKKGDIIPPGLVNPIISNSRGLTVTSILTFAAILVFSLFLGIQLKEWLSLPELKLYQPEEGETYGELVTVKGKTDPDATITINNQSVIVGSSGEFNLDLILPAGTHKVFLQSTSRSGKASLLERSFTVSK